MKRFEVVKTMSDNNVAVKDMTDMTTHQMLDYGSALDVCILLNKLNDKVDRNEELKNKYVDEFALRETLQQELRRVENENEELKKEVYELREAMKRLMGEMMIDKMTEKMTVDVYKHFSNNVLKILAKYEIDSLEKLDRILMEQRVW